MADKSTFIILDRNILEWEWYRNANTMRVFLHCLLKANALPKSFEGIEIQRGSFVTSYSKLAEELQLSIQNVRTAISHLESTHCLTSNQHSKFSVISIENYDSYQSLSTYFSTGNQQAANRQLTTTKTVIQENSNNNINSKWKNAQGLTIDDMRNL